MSANPGDIAYLKTTIVPDVNRVDFPNFQSQLSLSFSQITVNFQTYSFTNPLRYLWIDNTTNQAVQILFGPVATATYLTIPAGSFYDHSFIQNRVRCPNVFWVKAQPAPTTGNFIIGGY